MIMNIIIIIIIIIYYYYYYYYYYYDYSQVTIQGIKTTGHTLIGVYVFLSRITRFVRKKRSISSLLYYS